MSMDTDERTATALERIADALERAHPKFNPGGYVGGEYEIRAFLSDKPVGAHGRIAHGIGEACIHGDDHPDDRTCEYLCDATMAGHRCTRWGHADDRHLWTMTDEEYDRRREEAGVPREVFDDVRAWADGREAAQRRLTAGYSDCGGECGQMDGSGAAGPVQTALAEIMTAIETGCDMVTASLGLASNPQKTAEAMRAAVAMLRETVMRYTGPTATVDARSLETGEPVPVSVTVRKVADPLDEDDHRPRHSRGGHIYRHGQEHWHTWANSSRECRITSGHGNLAFSASMVAASGATIAADPLDESDHRPRHDRNGEHVYRWGTGHWHSKSIEEHPGWCDTSLHNGDSLADWARASGPLTFCDCDAATIEAENGATD